MTPEDPQKAKAPVAGDSFGRAVLDRNLVLDDAPFRRAIGNLDLSGLAILDFGCGTGFLEHLLKNTNADVIYAFEVFPGQIDDRIKSWAQDPAAKPRLIVNPPEFMIDPRGITGDLTNYDYEALLAGHDRFAIISNPPYFLSQRILSLTGTYLGPEDSWLKPMEKKFAGALMLTSKRRLANHPGWTVVDTVPAETFSPAPNSDQYLIRTGFEGRIIEPETQTPALIGVPQRYVAITNRNPAADPHDHPEMWAQLNRLRRP